MTSAFIAYDDSEFPDCRGWRPIVTTPDGTFDLTDLYDEGYKTAAEAMAMVEKWCADRNLEIGLIDVTIFGKKKAT